MDIICQGEQTSACISPSQRMCWGISLMVCFDIKQTTPDPQDHH
jgi:hypothetical protein